MGLHACIGNALKFFTDKEAPKAYRQQFFSEMRGGLLLLVVYHLAGSVHILVKGWA